MRFETALAIVGATVVAAKDDVPSGLLPGGAKDVPKHRFPGHPDHIGPWEYYGCVQSKEGFPTFQLALDSPQMTLELCAASCHGKYFGTATLT